MTSGKQPLCEEIHVTRVMNLVMRHQSGSWHWDYIPAGLSDLQSTESYLKRLLVVFNKVGKGPVVLHGTCRPYARHKGMIKYYLHKSGTHNAALIAYAMHMPIQTMVHTINAQYIHIPPLPHIPSISIEKYADKYSQ